MSDLSRLQRSILAVLPERHDCAVPTGAVIEALGFEKSSAKRVSVSRALARLVSRGAVLQQVPEARRPGRGRLYTRS